MFNLTLDSDEVGGSSRGGCDVFVVANALFTGSADDLRKLLGDKEALEAALRTELKQYLPWAQDGDVCPDREAWDGKTEDYFTEEDYEAYVKNLGAEQLAVVPVRYSDDPDDEDNDTYLVTGETEHNEFQIRESVDGVVSDLVDRLTKESYWRSRLDDPSKWSTSVWELYREGNAE